MFIEARLALTSVTHSQALLYTQAMRFRTLILGLGMATAVAAQTTPNFPPLEEWKAAVVKGDAVGLKSQYSSDPAAQISTISSKIDADADVTYWLSLKAKSMTLAVVESESPQPGVQAFTLQVKVKGPTGKTTTIVEGQTWLNEGGTWKLVRAKRDLAKLEQPLTTSAKIYPTGDAHEEIRDALDRGSKKHKNLLVIFGADWCYDCHVLDKAFHRPDVAAVLTPNFEVVHIDIGEGNKNQDIANQYQVPLNRGIPALAVVGYDGKLLYSQQNGEWERARALGPQDLLDFLNKWKPKT